MPDCTFCLTGTLFNGHSVQSQEYIQEWTAPCMRGLYISTCFVCISLSRLYSPPKGTETLLSRVLRGDTTEFPPSAPSWWLKRGDVAMIVVNNTDGGEVSGAARSVG